MTPHAPAPPAASSSAVVEPGFVPLVPWGGMAPATEATQPPCRVTEYLLGPLANPGDNLFPVQLVADAHGAVVAWMSPNGLLLKRFDVTGAPAGEAVSAPAWKSLPVVLLSREEVVLVAVEPTSITVARFERSSLRAAGARTVPRPDGLDRTLESAVIDGELLMIGVHDRDLVFFRVPREGESHRATVFLPAPLPGDPGVILGRWDGEPALWISTIRGDSWLASASRVEKVPPETVSRGTVPHVRTVMIDLQTGATSFGLQTELRYPLSRREEADRPEQKPAEAFRLTGTYGFPLEGRTGNVVLFGEAAGKSEPNNLDKLQAQVSTVRCGGK